ncbi:uncharacterized protein LOC119731137 [Patiria miniata]|uniref:Uncharacterized protein n=1 Tax=Patiria miniata TaxID=46514 RepID=A0A914A9J9_PATMI|nr:uncharacterized protein LOC119731137 [Patiria miniata]
MISNLTHFSDDAFPGQPIIYEKMLAGHRPFRSLPNVTHLSIRHNSISFMERGTFSNVTTLRHLHLDRNSIISIEDGTFPEFVETINLTGNDFYFLNENSFTNLTNLTSLIMDSNRILVLPETAFDGCTSLSTLSLANNSIGRLLLTHIEDCPISTRLSLSNNEVSYVEDGVFADINSTSVIDLSANQLTEIPRANSFVNLTFTGEASLNLRDNRITSIRAGDFENIDSQSSCTVNLLLNDNPTKIVHPDAFRDVSCSANLDLSNNRLNFIKGTMFVNGSLVNIFRLDDNRLTIVPDFSALRLMILRLNGNLIAFIPDDAFAEQSALQELLLGGNPLGCTCNTISSLSHIANSVSSAVCAMPTATSGIELTSEYIQDILNSRSRDVHLFQCGPYGVQAKSPVPGEILLKWTAPSMLNFYLTEAGWINTTAIPVNISAVNITDVPVNITESQHADTFSDEWLYEILCSSHSAPSVRKITNETQIVLSNHDGVVYGGEYTCQVMLSVSGYTSAPDEFVTVVVDKYLLDDLTQNETSDIVLNITYRDFSIENIDFNAVEKAPVSKPTYMLSPYRTWLALSNNSSDSMIESWFRDDSSINSVHEGKLVLSTTNTTNDHQVFRFTSAIHTCINFTGSETIVLGGGEEVWLYVNTILLMELHSDPTGTTTPCKRTELVGASEYGEGFIVPELGTLIDGECLVTDIWSDEKIDVNLKIGDLYRLDIFHTERNPCSSAFFLQVGGVRFDNDCRPIDYTFYAAEDLRVGDVIGSFAVSDALSTGYVHQVTILNVDEAQQFTVANYSDEDTSTASPSSTDAPLIQTVLGHHFFPCNRSSQQVLADTEESSTSSELSNIHTDRAILLLSRPLDYEVTHSYHLRLKIVDAFARTKEWFVVIKIYVEDVNDNCPELSNVTRSFYPLPVLQQGPIGRIMVEDADSGVNSQIQLHIEKIQEIPLINDTFTVVQYQLVAVDGGIPTRGVAVDVNITVSQSCLYDAIGDPTPLRVYVVNTGDLYLKIPQYYLDSADCNGPLGMEDGSITDRMLSASSSVDKIHEPNRARLNGVADLPNSIGAGWIPDPSDTAPWYQVNLTSLHIMSGLRTQGCGNQEAWIETYKLAYSNDSLDWRYVTDKDGAPRLFLGNSDQTAVVEVTFGEVYGQFIRILPQSWHNRVGLRFDIIGCRLKRRIQLLSECQRCLTTFYCDGSGHQLPCGRCVKPETPCNMSVTQHSFGHAAECSSCPVGWLCKDGYATPCPKYHHGRCNTTECPAECALCDPGTVCFRGIQSICPPGFYSGVHSEFCQICPPGTFQNQPAQESCLNCPAGYGSARGQAGCSPCGRSTYSLGDGSMCQGCTSQTFCPCFNEPGPCFPGATCVNTGDGSFECLECPRGYEGNGITCVDIDECATTNPCWDPDSCRNLLGGYECGGCPPGYQGYTPHGIGITHAERSKNQTCVDINECAAGNGGCHPLSECINSVGSFRCGLCPAGYFGNGVIGCSPGDFCVTGKNGCHVHADCISTGAGTYKCRCRSGWAGNGLLCGSDADWDGRPSLSLACSQETCKADNCPKILNRCQEDNDRDQLGDVCDEDDDNDSVHDIKDNCPYIKNYLQEDSDGDGVGDICDNCPDDVNGDQEDNDNDGLGDECDLDDDNDGHNDTADNCPLTANEDQSADRDSDGIGDACDSCPDDSSSDTVDTDQNGYSDPCDPVGATNSDNDGDGVLNLDDNCFSVPNADQTDTDLDGIGDVCDDDKDGDGINDAEDNCQLVPNPRQEDLNGNNLPDACESDQDGDGTIDSEDICPRSNRYQTSDFSVNFISVELDPSNNGGNTSKWSITDNGREIRQLSSTVTPCMLIGQHALAALDYSGTFFVNNPGQGNGYIGFVFGYQSNRKFYLVMWRRENMNNANAMAGIRGLQVKKVHSSSGPGQTLSDAIYHSYTTANEVELIWHDPLLQGWDLSTGYRWTLRHRPDIGLIRVLIEAAAGILVDSGDLYDTTYAGGRLGVFVYNQPDVIWSDLSYKCVDRINQALRFDGLDDYVILPSIQALDLTLSFTLEAWIHLPVNYTMTKLPVICTMDSRLCMYILNGSLIGQFGDRTANSTSALVGSAWHHVAMRLNVPTCELSVFVNGTSEHAESSVSAQSWQNDTEVFIGRDDMNFYAGTLDEVRIWGLALSDHEVHEHMQLPNLDRQVHKNLLDAHYNMDNEEVGSNLLLDQGSFSHHGSIQGRASFVPSSLDQGRYRVSHPDSRRRKRRSLEYEETNRHQEL